MYQNSLIALTCCLAVALVFQHIEIEAACNSCSKYGISCVNETAFNLCENGVPKTNKVYNCPSAKQCSATSAKCVEPTTDVAPTCQINNTACGVCDGTKIFACTSTTSFVQCDGETVTNVTGTCSTGLVCDSRGGELCKNECTRPATLECDNVTP